MQWSKAMYRGELVWRGRCRGVTFYVIPLPRGGYQAIDQSTGMRFAEAATPQALDKAVTLHMRAVTRRHTGVKT